MYKCQDCGKEFPFPLKTQETHSLQYGPYEQIRLCPYCKSHNFLKVENNYCRYCGMKIATDRQYCSASCKKKGEIAYEREKKAKENYVKNPLIVAVRQVEEHNRKTGKKLSYGEYFAGRR